MAKVSNPKRRRSNAGRPAHRGIAPVPEPRPGDGLNFGLQLTEAENDEVLAALARAHPAMARCHVARETLQRLVETNRINVRELIA